MVRKQDASKIFPEYKSAEPFNHIVLDQFFDPQFASSLSNEFPDFNAPFWYSYDNAIENKRASNSWDRFPSNTYNAFTYLCSQDFIDKLQQWTGIPKLYPDIGLNGGGWHAHSRNGKLNIHLDYSIHPKLNLQRKLNLIVYLTEDWKTEWGGGLQFWSHNAETKQPDQCIRTIDNVFNRAVLFDTTQNSWHGLPDPIQCPENFIRKSIAIYYLIEPDQSAVERSKALYAPHGNQKDDQEVLELIKLRSGANTARDAYRKK